MKNQSNTSIVLKTVGALAALGVLVGLLGWGLGWFNKSLEVVGPSNVSAQHHAIIQDWESLIAASRNACGAVTKTDPNSPVFVEDPAQAYAATYRSLVADFNRRQNNLFEAKIAGPANYPTKVPSLDHGPTTNWCQVGDTLSAIPVG